MNPSLTLKDKMSQINKNIKSLKSNCENKSSKSFNMSKFLWPSEKNLNENRNENGLLNKRKEKQDINKLSKILLNQQDPLDILNSLSKQSKIPLQDITNKSPEILKNHEKHDYKKLYEELKNENEEKIQKINELSEKLKIMKVRERQRDLKDAPKYSNLLKIMDLYINQQNKKATHIPKENKSYSSSHEIPNEFSSYCQVKIIEDKVKKNNKLLNTSKYIKIANSLNFQQPSKKFLQEMYLQSIGELNSQKYRNDNLTYK